MRTGTPLAGVPARAMRVFGPTESGWAWVLGQAGSGQAGTEVGLLQAVARGLVRRATLIGLLAGLPTGVPLGEGVSRELDPAPRLQTDRRVVEFGQVSKGQIASDRVVVRNVGEEPLVIESVRADCKCIHVSHDEVIPPGQEGTVRIKLDSARVSGTVRRTVALLTNDPVAPLTKIQIKADVLASVILAPRDFLHLSNARSDFSRPILVVRKDPRESGTLVVSDIELSVPWLAAATRRIDRPQLLGDGRVGAKPGDWLIEVWQIRPAEYGRNRQTLRFRTGLEREPVVEVPILVRLEPAIVPSERQVVLKPSAAGPGAEAELTLKVRRTLDPADIRVETSEPSLIVDLALSKRTEIQAMVRWCGQGSQEGSVTFRIGMEGARIPVVVQSEP